jgi:SAM-dependent methyltransferase
MKKAAGRGLVLMERAHAALTGGGRKTGGAPMGVMVSEPKPLDVWHRGGGVVFGAYESFSHALWRAQELSLFEERKALARAPILDFGCGDGAFAKVVFESVEIGIDCDPESLRMAKCIGTYCTLAECGPATIPVGDGAAGTVISNSVLEHVDDLGAVLRELHRVLAPGGALMFTAPSAEYTAQMARYFGRAEADRINRLSTHRNLLTPAQWRERLAHAGFSVEELIEYQPAWMTFWIRASRVLGFARVLVRDANQRAWARWGSCAVKAVRRSITEGGPGANVFVSARKGSEPQV